ncbi:hypothetical protein V6N13_053627 [Hibiscus sabdariffa]
MANLAIADDEEPFLLTMKSNHRQSPCNSVSWIDDLLRLTGGYVKDESFQLRSSGEYDDINQGVRLENHSSDSGNQIKRDQLGDFCLTQSRAIYGQTQPSDMEIQVGIDVEDNPLNLPEGNKRSRTHLSTIATFTASDSAIVPRGTSHSPLLSSSAGLHEQARRSQ